MLASFNHGGQQTTPPFLSHQDQTLWANPGSLASLASLIHLGVQKVAPKLQARRVNIAKRNQLEGEAQSRRTEQRQATTVIQGSGRGSTAENKHEWVEAEEVQGCQVVHQRSVSRMIRQGNEISIEIR